MRPKNMLGNARVTNRRVASPVGIQGGDPQFINEGLYKTLVIDLRRFGQRAVDVEDHQLLHREARIGMTSVCIGAPVTIASPEVT